MHPVIAKTFGGLSRQYYVRQFLFGLIFPVLLLLSLGRGNPPLSVSFGTWVFFAMSTLLYPYSRFVYESVIGYTLGRNTFFVHAGLMIFAKAMTMALCWFFAIFVAPLGLLYLYIHHSRNTAE